MKALVGYWFVGCVLLGLGIGTRQTKCPNEKPDKIAVILAVATWPVAIGMAFTWKGELSACEPQS